MDIEQKAIERIKLASEISIQYYGKPLVCTYSGGKDSDVMLELHKRSGVPFEVHNSHTTADAPQTVYHIRKKFRELELKGIHATIEKPMYQGKPISMWKLIPMKLIPPTRMARYCCQVLKETGCANRYIATGVRWDESKARSEREAYETIGRTKSEAIRVSDEIMLMNDNSDKRKMIEKCELKAKTVVNPIIDWKHNDIWEYINVERIEVNELYQCGYERVGCIGCPMASKRRYKEFADFPKYKQLYINAFRRMIEFRKSKGLETVWKTGEEVFLWWLEDKNVPGQLSLFDEAYMYKLNKGDLTPPLVVDKY
jgi:phosphoadenosine phosphosulfate reductase